MAFLMTGRRRNLLINALGDLAVRVCVGGGFILGALAGWQGHPRAASCPRDGVCVGEQLLTTMWSVFAPATVGALAGLAASLVVLLLLRRLRPRQTSPARPLGRWISARHAGRCRRCSRSVEPGDRVIWDATDKAVICATCVN